MEIQLIETMSAAEKLYEGKAKIVYHTEDTEIHRIVFKDSATAFNGSLMGKIEGKGEINCTISAALFECLSSIGIPTHYISRPQKNQMRVRAVKIIPLEVVVRNIAAGSLVHQTGLPEGKVLQSPLVEFYLKNDSLSDPLLTRDRLLLLDLTSPERLEQIEKMARNINQYLTDFFQRCRIILVDFKLEFGLDSQARLLLADEISPDTCRLWDATTTDPQERIMDKDRFRRNLPQVESAYQEVFERVLAQNKIGDISP